MTLNMKWSFVWCFLPLIKNGKRMLNIRRRNRIHGNGCNGEKAESYLLRYEKGVSIKVNRHLN